MTFKTKLALAVAIFLWASAFVAIRAALVGYSPGGLALLRFMIAGGCMGLIYWRMPTRSKIPFRDVAGLLATGAVGIGVYNIMLNSGEMTVPSGVASFIVSQSPILTAVVAILFLGERLNLMRTMGFVVSVIGVVLIAVGQVGGFTWDMGMTYMIIATVAGASYSILQKPYLKKYRPIEATTLVIWGGLLFLLIFTPDLMHDLRHASLVPTLSVVYLGIFPAVIGYMAWSYALSQIPASRAISFIYFSPFISTILGWLCLDEVPVLLSVVGGILAIAGVWFVNHSYRRPVYPAKGG
jgi:drug/metabolite transporter (DMT)-like permease